MNEFKTVSDAVKQFYYMGTSKNTRKPILYSVKLEKNTKWVDVYQKNGAMLHLKIENDELVSFTYDDKPAKSFNLLANVIENKGNFIKKEYNKNLANEEY